MRGEGSAKKDVFRFAQKSEESCMRKKDLNGILPVATEVDAIWPCTSASGGESTALLLTGGEVAVFENCSSWTLATVYAERAGRDLRTLRTLTGGIFGDTKASILPINLSLVLVALKYRRPGNGSRQSTVCYVNAAHECRIVKNPVRGNCGAVRFPSGYVLPLLWSEQTLQTKLARGRLVQYRQAVYLRQELSQLESSVRSIYEGGLLA